MTVDRNTLYVTTSSQEDGAEHRSVFVVDDEMRTIEQSEVDDLIFRLRRAEIDSASHIPFYDLLCNQMWSNSRQRFGREPSNMHLLILLYRRLEERVDGGNINRVVCEGLQENYRILVKDFCDEMNITFVDNTERNLVSSYIESASVILSGFLSVCFLFIDQLFSLVSGWFFSSERSSDIAVMFPVSRPKTFAPIYNRLELDFDTIYTLRTIGYVIKYHNVVPDSAKIQFSQGAVDRRILLAELKSLWTMCSLSFGSKSVSTDITDWVHEHEGVRIPRLVQRLYLRTALSNIATIFTYITASNFFEKNDYEKVLVPGIARTSRGLSYAATDQGVDVFQLHHGIGGRQLIADKLEHTRFTPGELNKRYIENSKNESIRPVSVGLPKHQTILEKQSELSTEMVQQPSAPTVLLTTQPYIDRVREEFVDDVISVVLNNTAYDVLIKPHPGANEQYYKNLITERYDESDCQRVTVDKSELYKKMYTSDLTITITSNTAIESVITGTPALSYNIWVPDIGRPLYVEYGAIPECNSRSKLRSFLSDYEPRDAIQNQQKILDGDYMIYGNSGEQIIQKIQSELAE